MGSDTGKQTFSQLRSEELNSSLRDGMSAAATPKTFTKPKFGDTIRNRRVAVHGQIIGTSGTLSTGSQSAYKN